MNYNNLNRFIAMRTEKFFSIRLTLVSLFMLISATMMAQVTVTGTVIDMQGEPIPGASVRESGTRSAAVTDVDGKYAISVQDPNAILNVSFIGYQTQTVRIAGRKLVTITLEDDETALKDIVIVGYGTMKKSDVTGAVSVVDTKEMMKKVPTNIAQALQGLAGGVYVSQQDGAPEANTQIRIRGAGTVFGSPLPLYVVDGVKVGTNANFLNPADIETLEILKDASATAIYGSEGANGVIMITTKHGQAGRTEFSFNVNCGIGTLPYKLDVIGIDELATAIRKSRENDKAVLANEIWEKQYDGQRNTIDWQDQMTQLSIKQQYGMTILGGNEKTQYNFALNYLDNKGLIVNTDYSRFTGRVGVKSNLTDFIEAGGDINFTRSQYGGSNIGLGNNINLSSHRDIAYMTPTLDYIDANGKYVHVNVVNPDGTYGYMPLNTANGWEGNTNLLGNVYATQMELGRTDVTNRFSGSAYADIRFFKGLNYHIIGSYTYTGNDNDEHSGGRRRFNNIDGQWTEVAYASDNRYNFGLAINQSSVISVEHYLTYKLDTEVHSLTAMFGNSMSMERGKWTNASGADYYSGTIRNTTLAIDQTSRTGYGGFNADVNKLSYYGRFVYGLYDLFNLTATIRRDGSSNFAKSKRWGTFPSISVGWRFDKEKFFPIDRNIVNMFKVRASYGVLGNEAAVGDYANLATLARNNMTYSFGNMPITGSAISTFVNPDIAWEKKKTTNVGIDIAMWNNRLEFTAEWYKNKSEDLHYGVPVPANAGVANTSVTMNAASMENSGFEFSATLRNNDHPVKWQVAANLSTLKNKVTSLGFNTKSYITGAYITEVGEEVGKFYGWQYGGIIRTQEQLNALNEAGRVTHNNNELAKQAANPSYVPNLVSEGAWNYQEGANIGDCWYYDANKDGKVDAEDQVVLGSGLPKINFGISARVEYKNFDLAISTFGALNYHVSDDIWNSLNSAYGPGNKDVAMAGANQWSADGMTYTSTVPRTYYSNSATLAWNDLFSERKIQNAAYWKIANIEIGYNFPDKWFKGVISGVRAYISAQNIHTFTKYKGYNVDYAGGTFTPGYNFCSFPSARTFMGGILLSF